MRTEQDKMFGSEYFVVCDVINVKIKLHLHEKPLKIKIFPPFSVTKTFLRL